MAKKIILVVGHNDMAIFNTIREHTDGLYKFMRVGNWQFAQKLVNHLKPDLIIASGQLTEADTAVLNLLKAIPVIVIRDSNASIQLWESVLNNRVIDYIKMPLDSVELNARIRTMLQLRESLKKVKQQKKFISVNNPFASSLIDFVPIPMFYQSGDGSFLGCNKSFEYFLKKDRKDIMGKTVYDIFSKPIAELFDKKFNALIQKPGDLKFEIEMAQAQEENKCLIVSYSAFYHNGHKKPDGFIASITDITEIVTYAMEVRTQLQDFNMQSKETYSRNIEKLQTELSSIQVEVSTHLGLLIQAENEQDKLLEEMNTLRPYLNNEGKLKLALLKQELNEDSWLQFETRFDEINFSFFSHLQKKCPDITRNEKKLCAYLKMNLGAAEIAKMTNKSPNSINVAFARLRSKLRLHGNRELKTYLAEF
jgi:PAS domain-containing protein